MKKIERRKERKREREMEMDREIEREKEKEKRKYLPKADRRKGRFSEKRLEKKKRNGYGYVDR